MAATIYRDDDIDLSALQGLVVAVLGYGSQGHAHLKNLRDSGIEVIAGIREGSRSWQLAVDAGIVVMTPYDACAAADVIVVLVPDPEQAKLFAEAIEPNLTDGKALFFAHGFNIHFGLIKPPPGVDVCLVAPKGPGHRVRDRFVDGHGVAALIAVEQDATGRAWEYAKAYAKAIGAGRVAVIRTTFEEETVTDLFGEQAVLCGGLYALWHSGFETLVNAGYQPEVVYFEVVQEMPLITDLVAEGGIPAVNFSISTTAEYGGRTVGPTLDTPQLRARQQEILKRIKSGEFAEEFVADSRAGSPRLRALREAPPSPVEVTGQLVLDLIGAGGRDIRTVSGGS